MTINVITSYRTTQYTLATGSDGVIVIQGVVFSNTYGDSIVGPGGQVDVLGAVAASNYGVNFNDSESSGVVYVGVGASISSGLAAIQALGDLFLENHGTINSLNGLAVSSNGYTRISNYGSISGILIHYANPFNTCLVDNFAYLSEGTNDVVYDNIAYEGYQESDIFTNSGTVLGKVILGTGASSILNNTGAINGAIQAAAGATINDSGTINGVVTLSSGVVNLNNAQITISGSGDTINLVTGPSDVVNLSGNAAWNNILGSNATINLSNALTGVVGGFNTINFETSTTDTVSLWNTQANWDNIFGSNGTAYLNHAITGVVGGGDTVYFNTGTDNIASLWNTNGAWDNVYGSNNTVYLSDAISGVVGGGDVIDFFYGTGNAASLWNTGGAADTVNNNAGVSGTLYINNAQANVTGSGDTVVFAYAGANSVTISGANETVIAEALSGSDTISGYNATDQFYLSAAQFGTSWSTFLANDVAQSGSNTLITDPANHANQITLVGVAPSSLAQGNFHIA